MRPFNIHTTHDYYTSKPKHWSPVSEEYAGGDHFISALRLGWHIVDDTVYAEQHWKSGTRPVTVFHFTLSREAETMIMPIVSNPFIERFITEQLMTIVYNDDVEKVRIG